MAATFKANNPHTHVSRAAPPPRLREIELECVALLLLRGPLPVVLCTSRFHRLTSCLLAFLLYCLRRCFAPAPTSCWSCSRRCMSCMASWGTTTWGSSFRFVRPVRRPWRRRAGYISGHRSWERSVAREEPPRCAPVRLSLPHVRPVCAPPQAWEEGDGPFPRCDDDRLLAWPRSVEDEVW